MKIHNQYALNISLSVLLHDASLNSFKLWFLNDALLLFSNSADPDLIKHQTEFLPELSAKTVLDSKTF